MDQFKWQFSLLFHNHSYASSTVGTGCFFHGWPQTKCKVTFEPALFLFSLLGYFFNHFIICQNFPNMQLLPWRIKWLPSREGANSACFILALLRPWKNRPPFLEAVKAAVVWLTSGYGSLEEIRQLIKHSSVHPPRQAMVEIRLIYRSNLRSWPLLFGTIQGRGNP